jgi:gliding motility-associated-like protein
MVIHHCYCSKKIEMHKPKKHIQFSTLFLLVLLSHLMSSAQVIQTDPRQVLGTTGGTGLTQFKKYTIDYTVGECMVTTDTTAMTPVKVKTLTQGFQQPDYQGDTIEFPTKCKGSKLDSVVIIKYTNANYAWFPNTNDKGNVARNLAPGVYNCIVYFNGTHQSDTIHLQVVDASIRCDSLFFYHGFTPNGDGHNDTWIIEGIENFETNTVSIFNRWGDLVWKSSNYNNGTVVWDGQSNKNNKTQLPDATYFYVVDAGGEVYKGWVELTR